MHMYNHLCVCTICCTVSQPPYCIHRITQKIHQTLGSGESKKGGSDDLFPLLPGSHLHLHNPALEFVKSICKVRCTCTCQVLASTPVYFSLKFQKMTPVYFPLNFQKTTPYVLYYEYDMGLPAQVLSLTHYILRMCWILVMVLGSKLESTIC